MAAFKTVNLSSYTDTEDTLHIHDIKVRPFLCVNVDKSQFVTFSTVNESGLDHLAKSRLQHWLLMLRFIWFLILQPSLNDSCLENQISLTTSSIQTKVWKKSNRSQTCWPDTNCDWYCPYTVITPLCHNFGFTVKVQSCFLIQSTSHFYHQWYFWPTR